MPASLKSFLADLINFIDFLNTLCLIIRSMKLAFFALLVAINLNAQAQEKPLLFITSFDGFGGETINNSNLVSAKLARMLSEKYEVSECLVPTIYDEGFQHARDCLTKLPRKPSVVLSMGEGSSCEHVDLETQTQNLDYTYAPDNAGRMRTGTVIIQNEAKLKTFNFFNDQTKSIVNLNSNIHFSYDMGNFVCNNMGFNMTTYLENYTSPRIPYTFIHVPPHTCKMKNGLSVNQSAQAISKLFLELTI